MKKAEPIGPKLFMISIPGKVYGRSKVKILQRKKMLIKKLAILQIKSAKCQSYDYNVKGNMAA